MKKKPTIGERLIHKFRNPPPYLSGDDQARLIDREVRKAVRDGWNTGRQHGLLTLYPEARDLRKQKLVRICTKYGVKL